MNTIEIEYKGQSKTFQTEEMFNDFLKSNELEVDSNGNILELCGMGVIPEILQRWFRERQEMRKKAAEAREAGMMDAYHFYNQRQQVWKIMLNSAYGVLGLPVFRFYDIDNAEAVTKTGVSIIKTTSKIINQYYLNKLGKKYKIVYDDETSEVAYENQLRLLSNEHKIKDIIHT